jgi:carboxymethylenebutenolidase
LTLNQETLLKQINTYCVILVLLNKNDMVMKRLLICTITLIISAYLYSQDYAVEQLKNSPRHHEWVDVKSGDRTVHCFVAYPERSYDVAAVIVIHENRGLTDWVRSFADQLAAIGYIAIAPDLLSGFSTEKTRTSDFENSDEARNAIYQLDADQITSDLNTVQEYIASVPGSNDIVAVVGFCWGGTQAFRFATNNSEIVATLVFYGSAPDNPDDIKRISAPVYGFYGENDQRIDATIPQTEELMNNEGKIYEYEIYEGAGHAFMRYADDPSSSAEIKKAGKDAWLRLKMILEKY